MITIQELEAELEGLNYWNVKHLVDEIMFSKEPEEVLELIAELKEEIAKSTIEFAKTTEAIMDIEADAYRGIVDREKTGNLFRPFDKDIELSGYSSKIDAFCFMEKEGYTALMSEEEAFNDFINELPEMMRANPEAVMPYVDKSAMFEDMSVDYTTIYVDGEQYYVT